MQAFAQQMPRAARTMLHLAPHSGSWLPFYWAGFQQTTRYTYQIDLRRPEEKLWSDVARKQRQLIRRGQKDTFVKENGPWMEDVYRGLRATLSRHKVPVPLSATQWQQLTAWLLAEGRGRLYSALPAGGEPTGHVLLVWDDRTAYFLVSTAPQGRMSDNFTMPTLVWHVVQAAKAGGCQTFDFEGSMLQGVSRFFRSFGALPVAYHRLTKQDPWFWLR